MTRKHKILAGNKKNLLTGFFCAAFFETEAVQNADTTRNCEHIIDLGIKKGKSKKMDLTYGSGEPYKHQKLDNKSNNFIDDLLKAMAECPKLACIFEDDIPIRLGFSNGNESSLSWHKDGTTYQQRFVLLLHKGEGASKGVMFTKNNKLIKQLEPYQNRNVGDVYCFDEVVGGQGDSNLGHQSCDGNTNKLMHAVCGVGRGLTLILDIKKNITRIYTDSEIKIMTTKMAEFLRSYLGE